MSSSEKYRNVFSENEIRKVLKKNLGNHDYHLENFQIKPASENLMGFLGQHYKITVNVKIGSEAKKLAYFVKKIPTDVPQHLDYALKTRAFYKEIELYKTLFEDLRNAQNIESPTKWCPEYYYSRDFELFVLEDLCDAGYYTYPERSLLDEEHVKASLKAMAAMHAASLVFEEKFNAGKISTLSPHFKKENNGRVTVGEIYSHLTFETEASDEKGHPGNTYHEAGIRSQVLIAESLPGYSDEEKKIITEKLPDVLRHSLQLVKTSKRFKNVFVHGDLWSNNLLFRKDNNGKVIDALIIDFQLARYAPPAQDIMMFLHLVQNNEFRDKRQQAMLEYYYEAFSRELNKNGLEVEELFPREAFLESCNYYQDLGLICKLFYFQLILAPSEITGKFFSSPDLFTRNMLTDRSEMVLECFRKDDFCRTRVTEAMKDVIQKFILV